MRRNIILGLSLAGLLGCSQLIRGSGYYLTNEAVPYEGESENLEYFIEGHEISVGGYCIERTIVLIGRNGLNMNPNHVDYVWTRDQKCDGLLEEWRFRDKRRTMTRDLEVDINHFFEALKFKKSNSQ